MTAPISYQQLGKNPLAGRTNKQVKCLPPQATGRVKSQRVTLQLTPQPQALGSMPAMKKNLPQRKVLIQRSKVKMMPANKFQTSETDRASISAPPILQPTSCYQSTVCYLYNSLMQNPKFSSTAPTSPLSP